MNFLEEKILSDGTIKAGNILKIDNFLNHQIDIDIMRQIAYELKRRFKGVTINKVLTIEASGIAIATMLGNLYDVPVVFAKKSETANSTDDKYISQAYSFTHKKTNKVFVSKPYLHATDRVLVVDDFMAQGGDPTGTGMGGSSKTIKGEFKSNGVDNQLSHTRGIVSMARSQDPDSASSQFFICYSDSDTFLDGNYAAFGEVTQGMEVVDDFLKVDREVNSSGEKASPKTPITIDTAVMAADDKDGNHRVLFTMQDFLK